MKKGIGIFLFLCMTMPFLVSYHWLSIRRDQVRKEIKQRITGKLDSNDLVILRFSVTESVGCLRWIEPGEFEYGNQMYDVVRSEIRGDQVIYHCYPDRQETALNHKVRELVAKALGHSPQSRDHQKRFFQFLHSLYLTAYTGWQPFVEPGHRTSFSFLTPVCISCSCEPPEPPPWIA